MSIWALELDDRTLATAVDGELRAAAGGRTAGRDALTQRHWHDLASGQRLGTQTLTAAAADLRYVLDAAAGGLRIATPPKFEPAALGQLLGLLRSQNFGVQAFVDSAAVTVAALGINRPALVVDYGLQHLAVARVDIVSTDSGPFAQRKRALVGERGGAATLAELWLNLVSDAMVRRTRYDPLHDARAERELFDALWPAARLAARDGSAAIGVSVGEQRYEVTLTRDQFAELALPLYRELAGLMHELRPAGAQMTVIVPQSLADLPGLQESLEIFAGCESRTLPDGFAACAASGLADTAVAAGGVRLLRRLPLQAQPLLAGLGVSRLLGSGWQGETRPSHVLHGGKALALDSGRIEIGRDAAVQGIVLPEGLAGVSRFHCSLLREADAVFLVDYSRYGTLVNGERVAGRARLRAGDTIRIGDPGVELNLIAVDDERAAPAR
jgi:hypothetical protein